MSRTVTVEVEVPDENDIAIGCALYACELAFVVIALDALKKNRLTLAQFIAIQSLGFAFQALGHTGDVEVVMEGPEPT